MSLYRSGSLKTVTWELARYKLGLMGVQGTKGALKDQGIIFFSMEKETKIINWKQDVYTPHNGISC